MTISYPRPTPVMVGMTQCSVGAMLNRAHCGWNEGPTHGGIFRARSIGCVRYHKQGWCHSVVGPEHEPGRDV